MTTTNLKLKLVLAVFGLAVLSGCATRAQTAALAGAIGGAVIANEMNRPKEVIVVERPKPTVRCHNHYIGRDYQGRTVYQQVCQTY